MCVPDKEKLVEFDPQSLSPPLENLQRGNCVSSLHAGDVGAEETASFFDVCLGEMLFLAELTEAFANDHNALVAGTARGIN